MYTLATRIDTHIPLHLCLLLTSSQPISLGKSLLPSSIHPQVKNKLEKFVWKKVEDKILSILNKCQKDDVIILDVPLLFESKLNYLCNKIVLIYCSQINQIKHLKNRNINDDDLIKINQNFDIENKKEKADYIIVNNGSIDDLKNQLNNII